VGGVGVGVILFLGNSFRWTSQVTVSRSPNREKLLRSPGENMRRNLEQLNEYLIYSVALFLLVPTVFAWKMPNLTQGWPLTFLIGLIALSALPGICVVKLYRSYALGLRAERAVGEELNQLMLDGCHVFHDYPATHDWHINHIVVAASGVYVVETKSSPRPRADALTQQSAVILDGGTLRFPHETCSEPLEQTRRSAAILSKELSDARSKVEVKPILSLPGWRVIRHETIDVQVLNPKEIWQTIVTNAPAKLSEKEIQQLAYRIQQKCRDVEI
jgi:hypothetical protein